MQARFGAEGDFAHRLARGLDERPLALGDPPPDLTVCRELDPPADRADALAFLAVGLADELVGRLAPHGLVATQLLVEAETEHGESLQRWWRGDRPFTARAMVDRVRWQLEGWLQGPVITAPTAGVTLLRLTVGDAGARRRAPAGFGRRPSRDEPASGTGPGTSPGPSWPRGGPHRGANGRERARRTDPPRALGRGREESREGVASRLRVASALTWPGRPRRPPAPPRRSSIPSPPPVEVLGPDGSAVGVTGRGRCTAVPSFLVRRRPAALLSGSWAGRDPGRRTSGGGIPRLQGAGLVCRSCSMTGRLICSSSSRVSGVSRPLTIDPPRDPVVSGGKYSEEVHSLCGGRTEQQAA